MLPAKKVIIINQYNVPVICYHSIHVLLVKIVLFPFNLNPIYFFYLVVFLYQSTSKDILEICQSL